MAARLLTATLGIWLMAAPSVLGYGGASRTNHLIVGPIVASFGIISIWQAVRPLRWVGLLAGLWLVVAPWLLGAREDALGNAMLTGLALIGLAFVRGAVDERFGGGWSSLWRGDGVGTPRDDTSSRAAT